MKAILDILVSGLQILQNPRIKAGYIEIEGIEAK